MSVNCHNSGRIPWNTLADSMLYKIKEDCVVKWAINDKKLKHFCNVFEAVIRDFSKTHKKLDTNKLNPAGWCSNVGVSFMYSNGAQIGFSLSLTYIYIVLNLLLLNSKRINETYLFNRNWDLLFYVCLGINDNGHNEYLESKFDKLYNKIYDSENKKIKLLTKDVIIEIRDYLSDVFICLVNIYRSEHKAQVCSKKIYYNIKWFLGCIT